VVGYGLRGEGLVQLIRVVVYLSYCTMHHLSAIASSGWRHNVTR